MGVSAKDLLAAGKVVAKATGKVAYENRDIIADGARMGMTAKVKKNQDKDAKQRYRDFLMWRESGMDMEEFAFNQAELSGRPWEEIIDNIRFHSNRVQPGASVASRSVSALAQKATPKALPDTLDPAGKKTVQTKDIRTYLKYSDVQECLGLKVTGNEDIPAEELEGFAELLGNVKQENEDWTSDYGRQVKRELLNIAKDSSLTVRDFATALKSLFNQAVSQLLIPNYMEAQEVIEKLCALDTRGEYTVISDKAHRALMIAYNSLN